MKLNNKNIWSPLLIIVIIALDQITKYAAKSQLYPDKSADFIKGIAEFRYAENTGAAFSMLGGAGGRWFLVALSTAAIAALAYYMFVRAQKNLWLYWSLAVLLAGAAGNLIDRVLLGYVIDFINPTFIDFAVFNIADCAVTLGSGSLIIYLLCDMFKKSGKKRRRRR